MTFAFTLEFVPVPMDAVYYQITGVGVVVACLAFLSVILTISGAVAVKLENNRKLKAAAAQAAAKSALAATRPAAANAAAVLVNAPEPTAAEIAALAAGIYNTARSSITPEIVAVIAAAVRATLGRETRILNIKPTLSSYAQSGRNSVMNSHFPKKA